MRRAPAHAGRLCPQDRFAFATFFAMMAAFAAVITMSAARTGGLTSFIEGGSSPAPAAGASALQPVQAGGGLLPQHPRQAGTSRSAGQAGTPAVLDKKLATALRPVVGGNSAGLAVGIADKSTRMAAFYHLAHRFRAGSLIQVDILAMVLLQHQAAGIPLSGTEAQLAASMMDGSIDATTQLWTIFGGTDAMQAANQVLGLAHTAVPPGADWSLASTTVGDELRLLTDLTSAASPLDAAAREYALGLLQRATAGQGLTVPAVAGTAEVYVVSNSWLADTNTYVVNCVGVVQRGGRDLLVAAVSDGNPTVSAGIARDQAAIVAAAAVMSRAAG